MQRKAVAAALALLAAPPAAGDLPLPNPDVRQFDLGDWELWCVIDRATATLANCSLSAMAGWVTLRIQVYRGEMHYNLSRHCIAGRGYVPGEYRSGVAAPGAVPQSAMWRDFVSLYQMPVDPACSGTPPQVGGNFQQNTETALAMLRTLHPLRAVPSGSIPSSKPDTELP